MKRAITILAVIATFSASLLYADFVVEDRGAWPDNWPDELEPLRKQSRTLEGPLIPALHRIPLPPDTSIIDERFKEMQGKSAVGLVPRAESAPVRRTDGTIVRRVERDQDGNVIRLLLNDLQLSARELEELGTLVHLRRLVLAHTNIADKDLPRLSRCKDLEHRNLSGTEVTDAAIASILELKNLNSLCLGNVRISADAIAKLNSGLQSRGQVVKLGYSQRTK